MLLQCNNPTGPKSLAGTCQYGTDYDENPTMPSHVETGQESDSPMSRSERYVPTVIMLNSFNRTNASSVGSFKRHRTLGDEWR